MGRGVEQVFPLLINKLFAINAPVTWHIEAAAQGIAAGSSRRYCSRCRLCWRFARSARRMILRRDMPEAKLPWTKRVSESHAGAGRGRR